MRKLDKIVDEIKGKDYRQIVFYGDSVESVFGLGREVARGLDYREIDVLKIPLRERYRIKEYLSEIEKGVVLLDTYSQLAFTEEGRLFLGNSFNIDVFRFLGKDILETMILRTLKYKLRYSNSSLKGFLWQKVSEDFSFVKEKEFNVIYGELWEELGEKAVTHFALRFDDDVFLCDDDRREVIDRTYRECAHVLDEIVCRRD